MLYFYDVEDMNELATLADSELKCNSYEGEIETFLLPYTAPIMAADLIDPVYSQRDGKYYVEAVKTICSVDGGQRLVTIGIKV